MGGQFYSLPRSVSFWYQNLFSCSFWVYPHIWSENWISRTIITKVSYFGHETIKKENRYNIIKFLTTSTTSKCLLKSFRHMFCFLPWYKHLDMYAYVQILTCMKALWRKQYVHYFSYSGGDWYSQHWPMFQIFWVYFLYIYKLQISFSFLNMRFNSIIHWEIL